MKAQMTQNSTNNPKQKSNIGDTIITDVKLCCRAIVTKKRHIFASMSCLAAIFSLS